MTGAHGVRVWVPMTPLQLLGPDLSSGIHQACPHPRSLSFEGQSCMLPAWHNSPVALWFQEDLWENVHPPEALGPCLTAGVEGSGLPPLSLPETSPKDGVVGGAWLWDSGHPMVSALPCRWAWILQDALGIAFCLYMLKTIRLPTFKVRGGGVLASGVF